MAWTLDGYPSATAGWRDTARQDRDALAHFMVVVDRMLYVATGALVVCVVALIVA